MTPTAAQQLAESVVADGFDAHRAALAELAAAARRRGVSATLVAIVADPAEPAVARARALGRVVVEYCRLAERADDSPPAPPPRPQRALVGCSPAA